MIGKLKNVRGMNKVEQCKVWEFRVFSRLSSILQSPGLKQENLILEAEQISKSLDFNPISTSPCC